LTGGYCAGKSSVAEILRKDGWTILSVDDFGHQALVLSLDAVSRLLGPQAINADGSPDRRYIGSRVFTDPALLEQYEAIIHPVMNQLTAEAMKQATGKVCIDAALLYRLPVAQSCNAILEVRAALAIKLYRAYKRDGIGLRAALERIARQAPLWKYANPYSSITGIIRNSGRKASLEKKIQSALHAIHLKFDGSLA
jgi:dephospho-CoA kinase